LAQAESCIASRLHAARLIAVLNSIGDHLSEIAAMAFPTKSRSLLTLPRRSISLVGLENGISHANNIKAPLRTK
jgi:hypothetical protein